MTDRAATPAVPPAVPLVHLGIRFGLVLACWGSIGWWAWGRFDGGLAGAAAGFAAFTAVALVWGFFKTPGEPTAGKPVAPIPGGLRLLLELAIFALASAALWSVWSRAAAETLMTLLALHVSVTWERQWWLLRAPRRPAQAPGEG